MKVNVLFIAKFSDIFSSSALSIDISDDGSIADLLVFLSDMFGSDKVNMLRQPNVLYAINAEIVDINAKLKNFDEIAIMPPVTGG